MQKPLTYDRKGFASRKLHSILTQILHKNQESRISELSKYIRHYELTNSLECLEEWGFSGDTAIFVLACCQKVAT